MFKQLSSWLDERTGIVRIGRSVLETPVPGGARWSYVFASALTMMFLAQALTGLLLMTAYSPSSSTAWGSVYYINNVMWFGWFIRGIHHFAAQALVVLVVLHLLQVLLAGAYQSPREVNWWFGMALLFLIFTFGHTGYQLPWDQKGFWSSKVVTKIAGSAPLVGPYIQKVLVGGTDYGNQTLTRFYGIHVGLLPSLFFLCLGVHIALYRKQGRKPPRDADRKPSTPAWPEQTFMNLLFFMIAFGIVIALVLIEGGANLDAPADASSDDYPARPEFFFLSLYQMLKLFPGNLEIIGTFVIPASLATVMMLLPLLDRVLPRRLAHFLACGFVFTVLGAAGYLISAAVREDAGNKLYLEARDHADKERDRAILLASLPEAGIPPEGSSYLLRRDPLTQGGKVLGNKCLGCHAFEGKTNEKQLASDLSGFGTKKWLRGLLENPASDTYFGKSPQCKGMIGWKKNSKLNSEQLDKVADLLETFTQLPADTTPEEWLNSPGIADHPGLKLFEKDCGSCHAVEGVSEGGPDAPGLFGWGSPRWTSRMIRKPGSPDKYGFMETKDQMPAFGIDQVSDNDIQMLIRYMKGDYPRPPAASASH